MLPSLTVAFLVGLIAGSEILYVPIVVSALLFATALLLTVVEQAGRLEARHGLLWFAALLVGVLYWVLVTPLPSVDETPPSVEKTASDISGRIASPVQHAPGRYTLLVETEEVPARKVRVVWREPDAALLEGDRVRFHGRLHVPTGSLNPGGFNYAAYLDRQGIEAVVTVSGPGGIERIQPGSQGGLWVVWNQIDGWRSTIREAAIRTMHQPALGIFLGIVIGERGYLQQDVQEWFMATGTVHLLSISGSHLGLVAVVIFWFVKHILLLLPTPLLLRMSRVLVPSRAAILVTWPVVCLYALLAGAELATLRSLVMISLAMVALWLGHLRHVHHAIAVAALVIILHDPRAIFDISFQLSFLSVLMMVQCGLWMARWQEAAEKNDKVRGISLARYGRDALLVSGGVTLATLPVVALYFHQIPWMGIVTNLLAIPVTGIVLVPVGLLGAVGTLASGADALIFSAAEESLLTWFVRALHWCAVIPGAEWHVAAPSIPAMAIFYAALWMVVRKVEVGQRRPRLIAAGVVALFVCWWAWSPRLGLDGDRWRVTFLDVGQGDSAVLEMPDGQTVLIDGGARYERFDMGRGVVAPFLWNRGIRHIDHVIGTHQQLDHVGGLVWILDHLSVGRYWGTGVERSEQFVTDLNTVLRQNQLSEHIAARGEDVLSPGSCRLTILNPASAEEAHRVVYSKSGTSLNNQSIVSRLQCGVQSVLFSADVEREGLRRLTGGASQPVTVLKVPHHGARSSLDREWIQAIHPEHAVISVGRGNPYGHPVGAVLEAYAEEHVTLSRTDVDGAVWITGRVSRPDLVLTRMRDIQLAPIHFHTGLWHAERENWRRVWLQLLHSDSLPFLHV
jgi:competence protein ComEC